VQLEDFLERSAARLPEKTALVCGGRRLTYREIDVEASRLAHALVESGVERGDRVAIFLDNCVEAVVSIFAVLKAGAVFTPVNPTTKTDKLTYILNNSRAKALVGLGRKLRTLGEVWEQMPHLAVVIGVGAAPAESDDARKRFEIYEERVAAWSRRSTPPAKRCIDVDLAALIYTSGSTGNPKGVMLTHLNMVSAATSITTYLEMRESDVVVNVLPVSFDYGLYQVLMTFKVGGTLVLEKSFAYPQATLELMAREKVTGFPIVPTIAAILLQTDVSGHDLSSLRYLTNTAAALPTEHIQRLRRLFPQATLFSMYGLTECKRVSYLPPDQLDVRPDSVGRGMPNEEVYVVDDEGNRVGPQVVGELVVRGSNVMKGYWELPEETAKRLKLGPLPCEMVLHTGDLFYADEEGYLYFVGRKDDIIKSRGEKVSPKEVENVLHAHPAVVEAAVIGVPDPLLGQAVKALVVLKPESGVTDRDLLRHCAARLEDFMVPKQIEIRDSLPKTGNGKINKRLLAGADV
jgi:amino acid adenylation domain-containing protein